MQVDLQLDLLHSLMTSVRATGAMVVIEACHLTFDQPQQPLHVTAGVAGSFAAPGSPVPSEVLTMLGISIDSSIDICCWEALAPSRSSQGSNLADSSTTDMSVHEDDNTMDMCLIIKDQSEHVKPLASKACKNGKLPGFKLAAASTDYSVVSNSCDIHSLAAEVITLLQEAGREVGVTFAETHVQAAAQHYVTSLAAATSGSRCLPPQLLEVLKRRHSLIMGSSHNHDDVSHETAVQPVDHGSPHSSQQAVVSSGSAIRLPAARLMQFEEHLPFVSQCEHHLLPFYGTLHISYSLLPAAAGGYDLHDTAAKPVATELLASVVMSFTRRLQLQ
jgi:hypothetical protein